jgi:hypothetical protein
MICITSVGLLALTPATAVDMDDVVPALRGRMDLIVLGLGRSIATASRCRNAKDKEV